MGLFDGAPPDGKGACADLARILHLPVVLVIDAGKMAGSVAALAAGFINHDPQINIAGVILNNLGSARHESMLRRALHNVRIFGAIPRTPNLHHPSRHLGLVQATEHPDLDAYLDRAGDLMARHLDLDGLMQLHTAPLLPANSKPMPPPGQTIAVAQDTAFAFCYPHLLNDWRSAGAQVSFFSPLADEPVPTADVIYLPGGYPELHAGRIAANSTFLDSLRNSPAHIYGECGGYMVLGQGLIDADGQRHAMAGLLGLETSFASRKLHLGYRHLTATKGIMCGAWTGHEFHYATTLKASGDPLFIATDAEGALLPAMGLINGKVSGSFGHLIDAAE